MMAFVERAKVMYAAVHQIKQGEWLAVVLEERRRMMAENRLNEWLAPVWKGGEIWEESVCFYEDADKKEQGGNCPPAPFFLWYVGIYPFIDLKNSSLVWVP